MTTSTTDYARRKQAGRCIRCSAQANPRGMRCLACVARTRTSRRTQYWHRRHLGLCVECASITTPGRVYCEGCLAGRRQRRVTARTGGATRTQPTTYYARRRQRGLCAQCPARAAPGQTRCQACAHRHRAVQQARYRHRKALGLCVICKAVSADGYVYCRDCRADQARYAQRGLTAWLHETDEEGDNP